ncbi:protein NEOXANTHIN-DEFICIENT 1 isoform X2 [Physcomitrium patens]|uniref:Protein NEOXANTHIN-DEFICIENT 1 n=1 Tax=Physcomitrium patens TaxID=3218 RepID=A9RZ07_PHYPA|nr:protein NEOXANTHIN-DEFICIENT 1-like isoform X2 [Physcomitrium patens]XP_024395212.1 protein NEOXANTHIN-DEFICIENT 1-like isoform X2 [Physcomitrium patens]PNR41001.1 hypothetical protein PHYPA_018404 [Physcomitrium patens]|eukprot:XP_024395211.1 protein NEOXANTHIN-DEFICIENT 1-like isoform X2 [Physcomitrella patens]
MSSSSSAELQPRKYADGPPWIFTGRALYQLHLVKAEVARRIIPSELKVVQAFGYTLGGFYLAKYDTSPAGVFDELVVLAGIVWNPPTSCAWAARVIVNSKEACDHGIEEVGLPSRTALFNSSRVSNEKRESQRLWWNILPKIGGRNKGEERSSDCYHAVDIVETDGSFRRPLCNIELLNNSVLGIQDKGWVGPLMKMSLPSFSGKTKKQPDLLKYSCRLNCRIRPVSPARISPLQLTAEEEPRSTETQDLGTDVMSVLSGKPIVALAFENMAMYVDAPTVVLARQEHAKIKEAHGLFSWFPRFKSPSVPAPST